MALSKKDDLFPNITYEVITSDVHNKYDLIIYMVDQMLKGKNYSHNNLQFAKESVLQREKTRSTGIGNGIAIPHGTTSAVSEYYIGFFVLSQELDFGAIDGKPIYFLCCIISPLGPNAKCYISLLAKLSRALLSSEFCFDLKHASSVKDLRIVIDNGLSGHAYEH